MPTTKLSSKGQVIIPKSFRTAHHWQAGQELYVIDTDEGILLKPKTAFAHTQINDVAACLEYSGQEKSLQEMEEAIQQGAKKCSDDCN